MNKCSYVKVRDMMMTEKMTCEILEVHEDVVSKIQKDMLEQECFDNMSNVFKMFADPTRLKILSILFQHELCVCDISALLVMNQSAVSHQLSVLRQNRIIKSRRSGKNIYYSLDDEHIEAIYKTGLAHIEEN